MTASQESKGQTSRGEEGVQSQLIILLHAVAMSPIDTPRHAVSDEQSGHKLGPGLSMLFSG